jgi:TetR/AcrR family transcriptional repressor of mexJK operon
MGKISESQARRLQEIERQVAAGSTVAAACAEVGAAVPSFYRWRAAVSDRQRRGPRTNDNRDAILEAARKLFMKEGFGVSMDRIATVAGVARQTLFNRFGNKERLFREVVQRVFEQLMHGVLYIEEMPSLAQTLENYGRQFLIIALDPDATALHRLAIAELRDFPDIARLIQSVGAVRAIPVLGDYLRRRFAASEIRTCDPLLVAECFLSSVTGHLRHRILMGEPLDGPEKLEARLKLTVDIFNAGLTGCERTAERES